MFKLFKPKIVQPTKEDILRAMEDIRIRKRLESLERITKSICDTIEPLINRDTNLDQQIQEIEKDIKRTWQSLDLVKVPTHKPEDSHIVIPKEMEDFDFMTDIKKKSKKVI
jgi:enoyl-[acyl-carrier-protein] reductase (NADH)